MGLLSILPERFGYIESGVSYLFIFLGVVTVVPWLLVFLYDATLYLWRAATHDIPYFGGAARGKTRPRAPSLATRPDGHRRRFSLAALSVDLASYTVEEDDEWWGEERNDSLMDSGTENEVRKRHRTPRHDLQRDAIEED